MRSGGGPSANFVERPTSRLSNLTTRNPRLASARQKSSCQPSIWTPSPMISSISGSPASPNSSYAISTPPARATCSCGTAAGYLLVDVEDQAVGAQVADPELERCPFLQL